MAVGVVGYGAAALAYAVLALLLSTAWRGRLLGGALLAAVAVTLAWAISAALVADALGAPWPALQVLLEVARGVAWCGFLALLGGPLLPAPARRRLWLVLGLLLVAGLALVVLDLGLLPRFGGDAALSMALHLGLAVIGLVIVEQLARNTRPDGRWATKFLYLAIAGLFGYDFYLYADALLFQRVDPAIWQARGVLVALTAPLLGVAAARNPEWSVNVFVSRRAVFHSAAVLGAGLYLLVMALVGYWIREFGGSWGRALQFAFLFAAGLLLLSLLFSGQLRAHLKVLLAKHFFSYRYDYREEWLRFTAALSAADDSELPLRERGLRALAALIDSPGGSLWARQAGGGYRCVAHWNMGEPPRVTEPADGALIGFLEARDWVVDLGELAHQPERYSGLRLPDWLAGLASAWLVVPLWHGTDLPGFAVLARPLAPRPLDWEDRDLVKTAGRQVAGMLTLLDATDALAEARQFEAFNRLSAFVVHDLKNVAAQLSLVVTNAARHRDNPAFVDDAIETVDHATRRMQRMLAQLRKGAPAAVGETTRFGLGAAVAEAVAQCQGRVPTPALRGADVAARVRGSREALVAVIGHLIENAQHATAEGGEVSVTVATDKGEAVVTVADTGCGMSEEFVRDSLFRPFLTTRGNAGMGIGAYEARAVVEAMGGRVEVASQPGAGTRFTLYLPRLDETAAGEEVGSAQSIRQTADR